MTQETTQNEAQQPRFNATECKHCKSRNIMFLEHNGDYSDQWECHDCGEVFYVEAEYTQDEVARGVAEAEIYGDLERKGKQLARAITDYLGDSKNSRFVVMGMAQEHRTLQQCFTGLCVRWLEHLASLRDGQFDLRNQASVELARKLAQTDVWADAKYLPYI